MKSKIVRVLALLCLSTCLWLSSACKRTPTLIFVANAGDDTVSVIDDKLEREIKVIPTSHFPQGLAIRQEPPLLAVSNSNARSVTLIDPVNLVTLKREIPVGRFPIGLEFSADGKLLYVANYEGRSLSVIDLDRRSTSGEPIVVDGKPLRLKRSRDGSQLYVLLHQKHGAVVVLDTTSRAVTNTIRVDPFPTDFALRPDGKRLFVASFNADTVSEIDLDRLAAVGVHDLTVGYGLLIHPRKPLLYSVRSFDDQVTVFDYEKRQEVATVDVGQDPVYSAITPDGRFLYIVNGTDGNVMKIDTETNEILIRIAVGVEPSGAVAFRP